MILPSVDVIYMHYPIFTRSVSKTKLQHLKNGLFYLIYHMYETTVRKKMKKVLFANSKFTSMAIKSYHGLDSSILYPSFSPFFLQDKETIHDSKRFDRVVTVSRFAPGKNLETLPQIARQLDKVRFTVIGNLHNKNTYHQLRKLINDLDLANRVVLKTEMPKDQLRQTLLNSKVYFHCTVEEHFGISIIEAMASGCIPIAHDSGGPREIVPERFRYKTIEEASEKIKKAIKDWSPEIAWEMRNSVSKFSQENFSTNLLAGLHSDKFRATAKDE